MIQPAPGLREDEESERDRLSARQFAGQTAGCCLNAIVAFRSALLQASSANYPERMHAKRYGNDVSTLKHVCKVGVVLGSVSILLVTGVAWAKGKHLNAEGIPILLLLFIMIGGIVPAMVLLTMVTAFEVEGNQIRWLVFGRVFRSRPLNEIRAIRVVRSPFPVQIEFIDGMRFRSVGMHLGLIGVLERDLKELNPEITIIETW